MVKGLNRGQPALRLHSRIDVVPGQPASQNEIRKALVSGTTLAAGKSKSIIGTALAAGLDETMNEPITYFITWTTYGAWLPGDRRGWRKWKSGEQQPRPLLEAWCRDRMKEDPVVLNANQRSKVEDVCRQHATIRGWVLHSITARSNHVHIAVSANAAPEKVRDQFKANATRVLRQEPDAIANVKIWTRSGDVEIIDGEDELEQVVLYINEAQDRMERGR